MSKNQSIFCIIAATIMGIAGIAIMANLAQSPVGEGDGSTDALFDMTAFDVIPEPNLIVKWPTDYEISSIDPNAFTITFSPVSKANPEPIPEPAFDDLLDAIEQVESGGDANAVGDCQEVGPYQLTKIYVDDVNEILGKNEYTYDDRWDRDKSREMVTIYLHWYHEIGGYISENKRFEAMSRIHNGGPDGYKKPSTIPYWLKVKERLEAK